MLKASINLKNAKGAIIEDNILIPNQNEKAEDNNKVPSSPKKDD
jgi:hypothetical protein